MIPYTAVDSESDALCNSVWLHHTIQQVPVKPDNKGLGLLENFRESSEFPGKVIKSAFFEM